MGESFLTIYHVSCDHMINHALIYAKFYILDYNLAPVVQRPDNFIQWISHFIIWLAPRAGKMSQILRCDWLPERARWSYLARSGLPVARPLGIESLIPTTMQSFLRFSRCFGGETLTKKFGKFSQHLPKGKEREWNRPGVVKILFQLQ